MIVVASNDNESPQVTLPDFSICVPVCYTGVLRRYTGVSSYNAPPHWGGALHDDTGEERCMTTLGRSVV